MKVRMCVSVSGTRDGVDWPGVGGVVEVSRVEAGDLVAAGLAVPVEDAPEAATSPAPETADAPKPAKKSARKG